MSGPARLLVSRDLGHTATRYGVAWLVARSLNDPLRTCSSNHS